MTVEDITDAGFAELAEPFRRELLAHCYRMLGSVDDAEDLVQETYLRAWRSYGGFEGRSSVRTWLYQIATNACLTALQQRARRALPSGLGAPGEDLAAAGSEIAWLQPMPDALVTPESADPAVIAQARDSLRLALIASFQFLPARQRAVLLLREVLAFPADQVAEMLGTSTVAVKSALQRARARLMQVAPAADEISAPPDPAAQALLEEYIAAFEHADAAALERLLRRDAALELPPSAVWFSGEQAITTAVAGLGVPGDWRMFPTAANGQPAVAAYHRGPDGVYRAFAIAVLTVATRAAPDRVAPDRVAPGWIAPGWIARLVVFGDPGLFRWFGFPPTADDLVTCR